MAARPAKGFSSLKTFPSKLSQTASAGASVRRTTARAQAERGAKAFA
jgi:hypothetical protein